MLKAVIFDFDGVLTDSNPLHAQANQTFLEKFGKIHHSSGGKREGIRVIDAIREYKNIYDLTESVESLYKIRQDIFFKLVKEKLQIIPDAYSLLDKIKQKNLKIALATSGDRKYINLVFEKFPKFKKYFSCVVTGDDVIRGKPYPDIYELALKKMFLKPNEVVVVEDSVNGILASKTAKISVIAIPNKYYPDADYSIANKIFDKLKDLETAIVFS